MMLNAWTTYRAKGRGVFERVVHIQQEEPPDPRHRLLPFGLNLGGLLVGGFLGVVFEPLHVVAQRVDQIVGELAIALPDVTKEIEVAGAGFEPAQVVDSCR
jgi:hypothetical protein